MSGSFPCRPDRRWCVLGVRSRAPPLCSWSCPRLPAQTCAEVSSVLPDHRLQERQGREKAEGKIKGGGTSLARKAVCTGVGGDTAPVLPGAGIVFSLQKHWPGSVPDTPYRDQLGGVRT